MFMALIMVQEMETKTSLDYYLRLPYTIQVVPTEDNRYLASVKELPGCFVWADRPEELWPLIEGAKRAWIETALEHDDEVPEPLKEENFSGKILARVPKSLHRNLVREAEREGVSLNQYVVATLASKVGV